VTTCLPLVLQVLTMLAPTPVFHLPTDPPLPAQYQPTLAPSADLASCEDMKEALSFGPHPMYPPDGHDVVAIGMTPKNDRVVFISKTLDLGDWGDRPLVVCWNRDWPGAPATWRRLTLLLGQQVDGKKCWGRHGDVPVS
jgi:hypothetical protein